MRTPDLGSSYTRTRASPDLSPPAAVARWLTIYTRAGHPVEVEENHRLDVADNEIVFRVSDWAAFTAVIELDGEQEAS